MSFGDHLEELRHRLIMAMLVPLPIAMLLFFFSGELILLLYQPLDRVLVAEGLPRSLQALGPAETLITQIKLSLIAAIVFSAPWILWQAWSFISPGLYQRERRFVHFLIPMSAILTVAGVALMYFVMLPLMLLVLVKIGTSLTLGGPSDAVMDALDKNPPIALVTTLPATPEPDTAYLLAPEMELHVALSVTDSAGATTTELHMATARNRSLMSNVFRLNTYMNFVLMLLVGITIAFQLPLVIVLAGWIGLVRREWLAKQRKYALFACAGVSAIITPADPWSMVMMLIPLYGLYELGMLLLRVFPASAVAEGRFSFRRSEKSVARQEEVRQPAQSGGSPSPPHDAQKASEENSDDEREDR